MHQLTFQADCNYTLNFALTSYLNTKHFAES